MVKPENFDYLHIVYHFAVPLMNAFLDNVHKSNIWHLFLKFLMTLKHNFWGKNATSISLWCL